MRNFSHLTPNTKSTLSDTESIDGGNMNTRAFDSPNEKTMLIIARNNNELQNKAYEDGRQEASKMLIFKRLVLLHFVVLLLVASILCRVFIKSDISILLNNITIIDNVTSATYTTM